MEDIVEEIGNEVSVKLAFLPSEQGGSFLDEYRFPRNGRSDKELIKLAWEMYYKEVDDVMMDEEFNTTDELDEPCTYEVDEF